MEGKVVKQDFDRIFQENFNLLFDSLHRYAYTFLKDGELADDAVQTVFIKWWETKTLVAGDEARKYLFTAVYRNCLNLIRNDKVKQLHANSFALEQERETRFHDVPAQEEMDLQIKLAIDALPPQCRIIFCMSRFEEKKYSEIAGAMNLSIKTVEAQMGKALKILREKLIGN